MEEGQGMPADLEYAALETLIKEAEEARKK